MSNGVIKNCALGYCCPPPLQQKALAVTLKEIAEGEGSPALVGKSKEQERKLVAGESVAFYMHLAGGLIQRGMFSVSPEEEAHLKQEASPTEAELDAMLAE